MKNLKIFIILITIILTSCENWLDVNDDPNNPREVPPDLVLPAAQASLAVRLGGFLFNTAGFFAQYWSQAPEANQYNDVETYDLRTDFLDDDYIELFAGALNDLEYIRKECEKSGDYGNYLVATTLRVYIYQMWVDMIDKVPYFEALKAPEILQPKWDNGEIVYQELIKEIDNAISKLNKDSYVYETDMILYSDINEWIGFANALKLKLLMRQSFKNDVKAKVMQLINENNFMTVDVAFKGFENAVGKRNPWYETTKRLNTDANHVATITIISYLVSKNDPRLNYRFNPAKKTKKFEGIYPALKEIQDNLKTSHYSRPTMDPVQPVYLYTLAELNLFKAEAYLRFENDKDKAKAAYEEAIDNGLLLYNIDPSSVNLYGDASKPYYFDINKSNDELFEQIMMQKWVALCMINNFEAWCELRRTKIPKYYGNYAKFLSEGNYIPGQYLNPAKNMLNIPYPNRLPYPDVAVSRNSNTPKLNSIESFENKIWWDVKN